MKTVIRIGNRVKPTPEKGSDPSSIALWIGFRIRSSPKGGACRCR